MIPATSARCIQLIQPGERKILSFEVPSNSRGATFYMRLTALSYGRVIDPQPTVTDRLIDVSAWSTSTTGGLMHAKNDGSYEIDGCYDGPLNMIIDAKPSFAIVRPAHQATDPIDAIEIVVTAVWATGHNAAPSPDLPVPYHNGVEAPLG